MTAFDDWAGSLHRGPGVVARWDGVVVVIPDDVSQTAAVEQLFQALGPAPPAHLVRRTVTAHVLRGPLRTVAYVSYDTEAGALVGFASGATEILTDGRVAVSGAGPLREQTINPAGPVTVRAANLPAAARPAALLDLRSGIAPGAGVTLTGPPTTPDEPGRWIRLVPVPERNGLPPLPIAPQSGPGPKPPDPHPTVGFVVFDNGSTYGLDRSYLIGRDPGLPDQPGLAPLAIGDDNETLSRRHAEIRIIGRDAHIVDLGSTNGTFLWDTRFERWNPLPSHQPVPLAPGDTVALGRRTFTVGATSGAAPKTAAPDIAAPNIAAPDITGADTVNRRPEHRVGPAPSWPRPDPGPRGRPGRQPGPRRH